MKAVLFCGDRSPYGRAHLAPLLASRVLTLAAVAVPGPARWARFRRRSRGALDRLRDLFGSRSPLRAELRAAGVPLWTVEDVNAPRFLARLRALGPEVLLCAAYPQLFGPELLALAPRGAVNFHPSLLPKYRGGHPHFWALARGEERSGLTAHRMTPELDAGDIVAQRAYPIADLDYAGLLSRMAAETPALVREVEAWLAGRGPAPRPQDPREATVFPADRDEDHRVRWEEQDAEAVARLARAGGAFFMRAGERVGLLRAEPRPAREGAPGEVLGIGAEGVLAGTRRGAALLRELRLGRRAASAAAWAAESGLRPGERLG